MKRKIIKFLLIGNIQVGKSSILDRFSDDKFNEYHSLTIGMNFLCKSININNEPYEIQLWDSSGHENFKLLTRTYYKVSDGIIIVYDISERNTFSDVKMWLNDIFSFTDNTYIILVGNKTDLNSLREVELEDGKTLSDIYNIDFIETSAKENININELFEMASIKIIKMKENKKSKVSIKDYLCSCNII